MRLYSAFLAVLALMVVPFHGEVVVAPLALIVVLAATLHRARPVRA